MALKAATLVRSRAWLMTAAVVAAAIAAALLGALLTFAPALVLLAMAARGVRPGERLLIRGLRRRIKPRRVRRRSARPLRVPRVRPVGCWFAFALAMRPPPLAYTAST